MFAHYYNILMADIDFLLWSNWLKQYIKKSDRILDAGCGSGFIMLELLKKTYNVSGIDIDKKMIELAKENLESNNILNYKLMISDLNEKISGSFEVVYALFDVVNYFSDVEKMFNNIYEALEKDGIFIFDIYKKDYLEYINNYSENEVEPFKYSWDTVVEESIINHTFKVGEEEYNIVQYGYSLEYYIDELKKVGFSVEILNNGIDDRKNYILAKKQ